MANVPLVRKRLTELLVRENAVAIVCSAACGADLIALEEAERLGLSRRIILPFSPVRFRETSVIDRPGDWRSVFNRLVAAAEAADDLIVLGGGGDDEAVYAAANKAIVREAQLLAEARPPNRLIAVIVWEGAARAGTDATKSFQDLAAGAAFEQRSVLTL